MALIASSTPIVNLSQNSEYRVRREGLWKVLDGGEMVIADFKLVLGSKTQQQSVATTQEHLGELTPSGKCEYKNSKDNKWGPVTKKTLFYSGGIIKTGSDGYVIITYNESSVLALIEPDSLVYCLRGGINFEKGKGVISVPSKGGKYMFDARMSRIRVRSQNTLFRFEELTDGAYLSVYKGKLQLALKAQGLPTSVTISPGFTALLKRSGLIKRPQRFKEAGTLKGIEKSVNAWFAEDSFEKLIEFTKGRISDQPEIDTSPQDIPAPDVPAPVQPPLGPTQIPSGAASDLEKLFQLPRMGRTERNLARPTK